MSQHFHFDQEANARVQCCDPFCPEHDKPRGEPGFEWFVVGLIVIAAVLLVARIGGWLP